MTFLEMIFELDKRGEKVISDRPFCIQTKSYTYTRDSNGVWLETTKQVEEK